MDLGGGFGICTYMPKYVFFSLFFSQKRVEKGSQAMTKLKGKRDIVSSIHLFVSFRFFKLGFN
jgi:hypothetical protein